MAEALTKRSPHLTTEELLAALVPPRAFARVSLESFLADPAHPSQAAAVAAVAAFVERGETTKRRRLFRAAPPERRPGLYLDGGFGVGKTHLLASLWHVTKGEKVYGTFVEYTNLVGALGFAAASDALGTCALVCIDEFELDDPGDTVLMSTLVQRLVDGGTRIAATSNTLPDRLGEGRFAADDFLREIQGLSSQFEVIRIDGEDYRHRGVPAGGVPLSTAQVLHRAAAAENTGQVVSVDDFSAVLSHLATVHPSRYGPLLADLDLVALTDAHSLTDQAMALRFVVLVDRLYDREVPVLMSGAAVDGLFSPEMLQGGYRKKYHRAISRLAALTAESAP